MKNNILKLIENKTIIKLDLGCGNHKFAEDFIGIDILQNQGVDLVGDAYTILQNFPNESVNYIYCHHFLEHISNLGQMVIEFDRILKKDGSIRVIVPHFTNPYYFSDYTHKTPFGLYTFSYLIRDSIFKRKVPNYQIETHLILQDVKLKFKSAFYYNYLQRKYLMEPIFNLSNFMKEIYESSFSNIFSCYEIEFTLTKK